MIRTLALLLPLGLTTACTSVKVNRLTEAKLEKVPANQVQQVSADQAKQKPNTKVATIDLRTRSPFAADLNALARKKTASVGGNVYVVTSGQSYTTVSGGVTSLLGDSRNASMSIDALRWQETAPAPGQAPAEPTKKKKRWFLF
jgi:hypothetical protein